MQRHKQDMRPMKCYLTNLNHHFRFAIFEERLGMIYRNYDPLLDGFLYTFGLFNDENIEDFEGKRLL